MRVTKKTNPRIMVDYEYLSIYRQWIRDDRYTKEVEQAADHLRHALGSSVFVEVVFDELPVCSHCGSEWNLDELGRPWCCDAAIEEWDAEHPELAAQLAEGGEPR